MVETSLFAELHEIEEWWAARHDLLKEHGYLMRPRYRAGWKASFVGDLEAMDCEDGQYLRNAFIMDAMRISDSYMVALKRVEAPVVNGKRTISTEERIASLFSNEEHMSNPQNHCVRVLQVINIPGVDENIVVMPWMRTPNNPQFRTIGEGLQFVKEMVEGLHYMHRNNVAHRDCSINNMLMDANEMYPGGWHPVRPARSYNWKKKVGRHYSRTRCPPSYYLIDFGFSEIYDPSKPRPPREAIRSGGTEPPEADESCDPFATDVFQLGTMIRLHIFEGRPRFNQIGLQGFEFLQPLVNDMIQDDPSKRPSMDEVISRFSELIRELPWYKLRSRAVRNDELELLKPFRALKHLVWTCNMVLRRRPAVPSRSPVQL
ncbi:hypothetical protein D9757_005261 [Collybiopsis confluens]|uniref:non-specific serine/threonine protein kinase n=1 Tax=Collybiopsis confluens TaxID=2823264 RepID=A0A8H5HVR7_9AGAR|nr:hypothetical protein D9757_005261 [Collybiopsis confluens]